MYPASSPLVPQRELGQGKGILVTFAVTVAFTFITMLITFVKGQEHYHNGFIVLGVALLFLFLSTAFLLNLIRVDSSLSDGHRRLAFFQSLALLFLCIAILVVLYQPAAPSAVCAPCDTCSLSAYRGQCAIYGANLPSACFGGSAPFDLYTQVNVTTPDAFLPGPLPGQYNCTGVVRPHSR